MGRIGFIKEGEVSTLGWDDVSNDFLEGRAPGGVVVPFIIDPSSGTVSYQLRSGLVRPRTFTGALETLLNQEGTYQWTVEPEAVQMTYDAWRRSVEAVTYFRFRLNPPNPHYANRQLIKAIVDETDAEVATLTARSKGGLGTDSGIFRQALDHVLASYGSARLEGITEDAHPSEWVKGVGVDLGSVPASMRLEWQEGGVEAPVGVLLAGLDELVPEARTDELIQTDEEA